MAKKKGKKKKGSSSKRRAMFAAMDADGSLWPQNKKGKRTKAAAKAKRRKGLGKG